MKVKIKILKIKDVKKSYVKWFSDKDVVRYSKNQYKKFSIIGQKKYVKKCLKDKNLALYGIFYGKIHIGNILLKGLISDNKCGEITYVLGDKSYWGKNIGSIAIKKIIFICKKKYKLNKIIAGCADKNIASKKLLIKNKFVLEGRRKKHLYFNRKWYDQLDYGLLL